MNAFAVRGRFKRCLRAKCKRSVGCMTGSLKTGGDAHSARRRAGGSVLVAGGTDWSTPAVASAEIYDPATGHFAPSASAMTVPRWLHTATLLQDGKVLFVGGLGQDYMPVADVEVYNPASDRFTRVG